MPVSEIQSIVSISVWIIKAIVREIDAVQRAYDKTIRLQGHATALMESAKHHADDRTKEDFEVDMERFQELIKKFQKAMDEDKSSFPKNLKQSFDMHRKARKYYKEAKRIDQDTVMKTSRLIYVTWRKNPETHDGRQTINLTVSPAINIHSGGSGNPINATFNFTIPAISGAPTSTSVVQSSNIHAYDQNPSVEDTFLEALADFSVRKEAEAVVSLDSSSIASIAESYSTAVTQLVSDIDDAFDAFDALDTF